jgi:hypothetical protein
MPVPASARPPAAKVTRRNSIRALAGSISARPQSGWSGASVARVMPVATKKKLRPPHPARASETSGPASAEPPRIPASDPATARIGTTGIRLRATVSAAMAATRWR